MKNKEFLKELKAKLESSKKILISELEKFAKKDRNLKDDWDTKYPKSNSGSGSQALEDAADEVEEYATLLPIEYSLELRLRDVNLALKKIKENKYGKCEKCGKDIRKERLKAYPEARFCSQCDKKQL